MLYLTTPPPPERLEGYRRVGIGVMFNAQQWGRIRPYGLPWAIDTGCFANPEAFELDRYLELLVDLPDAGCLFATAPDALGDPARTWRLSEPVLPLLRALGRPAALVAQDGLEYLEWDAFDCLFIGGTTGWKLHGSPPLIAEALRRGKWVHVGRINSQKRYRYFRRLGAHSADGTHLAMRPDRYLKDVEQWPNEHPSLF